MLLSVSPRSAFHIPAVDDGVHPLGKNWPKGFYKNHLELKAGKTRTMNSAQASAAYLLQN
jgi:hypothetical protein